MKKFFVLAAAAAMVMASCTKEEVGGKDAQMKEVTFSAFSQKAATKGIFADTKFRFCDFDQAAGISADASHDATMYVAAYNVKDGKNYFTNQIFEESKTLDNIWHAKAAGGIWWPLDTKLNFLAIAQAASGDPTFTINWSSDNAASYAKMSVPESYNQIDLVYAGAMDQQGGGNTPLAFKHSQAWIQFHVIVSASGDCASADAAPATQPRVLEVALEDVYTAGDLTIIQNADELTASWNFSADEATDYYKVTDAEISAASGDCNKYFNKLLPEQAQTKIVVKYSLPNITGELKYEYELPTATWKMGYKYVYNITVSFNEILIKPDVTTWIDETVTDIELD